MQQVGIIKNRDKNVLTGSASVKERWMENFEVLMKEESVREHRGEEVTAVEQEVHKE